MGWGWQLDEKKEGSWVQASPLLVPVFGYNVISYIILLPSRPRPPCHGELHSQSVNHNKRFLLWDGQVRCLVTVGEYMLLLLRGMWDSGEGGSQSCGWKVNRWFLHRSFCFCPISQILVVSCCCCCCLLCVCMHTHVCVNCNYSAGCAVACFWLFGF